MIKVNDKYYVQHDYSCCTVYEKKWREKKQEYVYEAICYPSDLASAVEKIMRLEFSEVCANKEISLQQAIDELAKMKEEYKAIFEKLSKLEEL